MTRSGSPAPDRARASADPAAALLARAGAFAALEPAEVVVGAACESEPLFGAEPALVERAADRVLAGLGAALVATGARRGMLAVRADWPDALGAARRAARGTGVEVVPIAPFYPADELVAAELGLPGARVLDVRTLVDLEGLAGGRPPLDRWISIAGAVARPRVILAPLGTLVADLVDATVPDPVALEGALRGRLCDPEDAVDRATPGLLVLPAGHALVRRRRAAAVDELSRARSACTGCRICTDGCPHALAGAPLEPHLALRALVHRRPALASAAAAALACTGCGLCDFLCPSGLHPSGPLGALAEALRAEGLAPPPLLHPAHPHPDRAGRRLDLELLTWRLGLGGWAGARSVDASPLRPPRVRLAVEPGRRVELAPGTRVARGAPLGAGLCASIDGQVAAVTARYVELRAA